MFTARKLVFLCNVLCLCSSSYVHRAIFEELPGRKNAVKQERRITHLFHKRFHQCSIDNACNYVVHYMNTNEYKKVGKATLLSFSQVGCKIWKKVAIEASTEGRAASEWSFCIYYQSKDFYARYLLQYSKNTL